MRNYHPSSKFKHAFAYSLLFWAPSLVQALPPTPQPSKSSDVWEKVLIALVSASLAFIGNFLLSSLKRRSEPRKQISYSTEVSGGLVTVADSVRQRIKVQYQNRQVDDLYHVRCVVENSGTTVVKDQFIRFALPSSVELVDAYLDPIPEPELGVKEVQVEVPDVQDGPGRRFHINHLEKRQSLSFSFIVTGNSPPSLTLHPFNQAGDVDFIPRSVSVASGQSQEVSVFVRLFILFFLVPPVLRLLPNELGGRYLAIFCMLFLLVLMVRRLGLVSTLIAQALQKIASLDLSKPTNITVGSVEGETVHIIGTQTHRGVDRPNAA